MAEDNDPRIFFAAERTLLAWVRTGLTMMGLGFVVARFGLFLRIIREQRGTLGEQQWGSLVLGVALILLGVAAVGLSAIQHVRFYRALSQKERPGQYSAWIALGLAIALAIVGLGLAAYLVLRSDV